MKYPCSLGVALLTLSIGLIMAGFIAVSIFSSWEQATEIGIEYGTTRNAPMNPTLYSLIIVTVFGGFLFASSVKPIRNYLKDKKKKKEEL